METYCSSNITELAKALIAVQKDMVPATKDATNPFCKSRYATLNSVMESCREALLNHGIWLTQLPIPAPEEFGTNYLALLTKLTHAESGQWQSSVTVAPLPKNDPQGYGSALTYCRRYALTAMLGMVTEDDDAEAAKITPKSAQSTKTPLNASAPKKGRQDKQSQGDDDFHGLEGQPQEVENLPAIDGVSYQLVTSNDGRQCVIATGNTMAKKSILKEVGFRWNAERKIWWRYADAA